MSGGDGLQYGYVKIKDGLFIGDESAARDRESYEKLFVPYKVKRVINCCGQQALNRWRGIGVTYLTYDWNDSERQIILDEDDVVANEIFQFVEEALANAESVLIHSWNGKSRSCCVVSAYLMKKYSWELRKTVEFLANRLNKMDLNPAFTGQLIAYESRLLKQSEYPFSRDWNDVDLDCEGLLLRNTYINGKMGPLADNTVDAAQPRNPRSLKFADGHDALDELTPDDKQRLETPIGADGHKRRKLSAEAMPRRKGILKKAEDDVAKKEAAKKAEEAECSTEGATAATEAPGSTGGASASPGAAPAAEAPAPAEAPASDAEAPGAEPLPVEAPAHEEASPLAPEAEPGAWPDMAEVVTAAWHGIGLGSFFFCEEPGPTVKQEVIDAGEGEKRAALDEPDEEIDGPSEAARGEAPARAPSPVTSRCGLDSGCYAATVVGYVGEDEEVAAKAKEIEELISWGTLGPLGFEKGTTCVEVFGLESEMGRLMNGQRGIVTKWIADKERYEVQLGPERVMSLKPANLRKLEDRERLLCLQRSLVEIAGAREVSGPVSKLRREATTVLQYGKAISKFLSAAFAPVFERYGVDAEWQGVMLAIHSEDEEIKAATKELEELTGWGTVGPDKWEKGCYLEVHGLTSEAGQKMNGMAVLLKGYDDAKGRYDVAPADDLSQTKALKSDNLQVIPVREFSGIEEATLFQYALIEAYSTPEAKEMLEQLKATCPNMQYYLTALKPRLLEFQKPVLAHFGFRPDFVGQQHMQRALGPYEAEPSFFQRNVETEQMLGLPKRG